MTRTAAAWRNAATALTGRRGPRRCCPPTTAHADAIRAQQWGLRRHAHRGGLAHHQGRGHHRRRPRHRRRRHPPRPRRAASCPARTSSASAPRRGDRAWARHGTAMAGIIAGHGHGPGRERRRTRHRARGEDPPGPGDPRGRRPGPREGPLQPAAAHSPTASAGPPTTAPTSSTSPSATTAPSAHPEAAEDAAVQYALSQGRPSSSPPPGNGGEKGDHISYPAAYPGVIAVTAVDRYGHPRPLLHPPLVRHRQRPRRRHRHRRPRPHVLLGLGHQRRRRLRLRRRRPGPRRPPRADARRRSSSSWRTPPATPPPAAATTPAASASSTRPPRSARATPSSPRACAPATYSEKFFGTGPDTPDGEAAHRLGGPRRGRPRRRAPRGRRRPVARASHCADLLSLSR